MHDSAWHSGVIAFGTERRAGLEKVASSSAKRSHPGATTAPRHEFSSPPANSGAMKARLRIAVTERRRPGGAAGGVPGGRDTCSP